MLVLVQLGTIILYYLSFLGFVEAIDNSSCNETERHLSNIIDNIFDKSELPSDLQPLLVTINNSNATVTLQNCSDIITLKYYLYDRVVRPNKNDLAKCYYIAFYPYVEMKYQTFYYKTYIPKTNSDIILLTNSFASTNLNPILEMKLHLFFFYYGNWLGKLTGRNFPFNNYKNPRLLLLDMICELINDPLYIMYEREVINFLVLHNHSCAVFENYSRQSRSESFINFQNFSTIVLNNQSKVQIQNVPNLFLNFSFVDSIKLKHVNASDASSVTKQPQILNITTEIPNLSSLITNPIVTSDIRTTELIKDLESKQTTIPFGDMSSPPDLEKDQTSQQPNQENNTNHIIATRSDINQNYQQIENQYIYNFTVWDIVEMDGPCTEGQAHVVKLNVQSLLTAIDKHVLNSSVEMCRKLLNNVKEFPIEDYNARGELLRDLLLLIVQEQADPLIKGIIEDILEHVMLDGPGALPPKIKLECVNSTEGKLHGPARNTRPVFNLEFDY